MKNIQTCKDRNAHDTMDFIRLDKFLKVSRIIKRRSIAKDFCDASRVYINDNESKAASKVRVGDIITIKIGDKFVKAKVTNINDKAKKDDAKEMYEIISENE